MKHEKGQTVWALPIGLENSNGKTSELDLCVCAQDQNASQNEFRKLNTGTAGSQFHLVLTKQITNDYHMVGAMWNTK